MEERIAEALNAIERGLGVVPTELSRLVERLIEEPRLRRDIEALLQSKRSGQELDRGPRIDSISEFLEGELVRLAEVRPGRPPKRDSEGLDRAFVAILAEVNGPAL